MGRLENLSKLLRRGIESPDDETIYKDDNESKFRLGVQELSPEREEKMIDQLVMHIRKMKMETPAMLMLRIFRPVSTLISQVYGFYAAPFMEIFGIRGYDYALLLSKKKNVKELMKKIEEKDDEV